MRNVAKVLSFEFLRRGYKRTYPQASLFQSDTEKEFPGINELVSQMNMGRRSIEDVVADELRMPGN